MVTGDIVSLGSLLAGINVIGIEAQVSERRIEIDIPAGISSVVLSERFCDSVDRGAIAYLLWWNLVYKYPFLKRIGIARKIIRILVEFFTVYLYERGKLHLYFRKIRPAIIENMMARNFNDNWS